MITNTIKLEADSEKLKAELALFLKEALDARESLSDAFIKSFKTVIKRGCIDFEQMPTSTGDIMIAFKFTDSFINFMAAFRAGDFNVS